MIEPPDTYTIVFKSGSAAAASTPARYRISKATIEQIAEAWKRGSLVGAYDVETTDGSHRKLMLRFADVLYIG